MVDTWSGAPAAVREAARLLSDRAGHYTYVSSRSVYASPAAAGLDEDGPLVAGASPGEAGEDMPYDRAKRGGETVADTWSWLCERGGTAPQRPGRPAVGLDPRLEEQLLTL